MAGTYSGLNTTMASAGWTLPTCVVGDDEAQITDLRPIDGGPAHFVDDLVADGEPDAAAVDGRADRILGAARPGRREAGCTRSLTHGSVPRAVLVRRSVIC